MIPDIMTAVLLTGHGGIEKLDYRNDVPTLQPGAFDTPINDSGVLPPDVPGLGVTINQDLLGGPVETWEA